MTGKSGAQGAAGGTEEWGLPQDRDPLRGKLADLQERGSQPVRIGTRRPGQVEVIEGLTSGELVITDGTLKVRPGSKVSIRAIDDGVTGLHRLLEQPGAEQRR